MLFSRNEITHSMVLSFNNIICTLNNFRLEAQYTVKDGTYTCIVHMHCLASVLGVELMSIYPEFGGFTVRPLLNRLCVPRVARPNLNAGNLPLKKLSGPPP